MSKISELSDGGSLVSSDYLIAVRSGGNVKVRMDQINVDQVDLGDNEFIRLGNSQDLTMVHTSTQSIINQAGIGDLLLQKAGTTKASITANGLEFPDNSKAIFGAGSDLQIGHDGSVSFITDSGTGDLYIQGSSAIRLTNPAGNETFAVFNDNGAASLYYDNGVSLSTTATGIDVTGTVTADGLVTQATANSYTAGAAQIKSLAGDISYITNVGGDFLISNSSLSDQFVLSSAGNVGIGVAPSADSFFKSLEIGNTGSGITGRGAADTHLMSGLIWDGASTQEYTVSSVAVGKYQITNGIHIWGTAPAGTAGDAATPQPNMTLDASGNLLVGKTAISFSLAGIGLMGNDQILATAASDNPLALNRLTTDGDIVRFYKDSAQVGSIGANGGVPYLSGPLAGGIKLSYYDATYGLIFPVTTTGAIANGTHDLGYSAAKFRDLYLSGTAKSQAVELEDIKAKDTSGLNLQTSDGQKRVVLDNSGNLLVGKTSDVNTANGITLRPDGGARFTSAGTGAFVQLAFFRNGSAGEVGSISTTSSATSYVTSSDQRLKENIADADDAGSKIDAIQVRKFDWKVDGSHQDYGMVAQELQVVAPEAVSAPEDPEEMMGVDYSKLVPMMLKEIQSLRARINALEAE